MKEAYATTWVIKSFTLLGLQPWRHYCMTLFLDSFMSYMKQLCPFLQRGLLFCSLPPIRAWLKYRFCFVGIFRKKIFPTMPCGLSAVLCYDSHSHVKEIHTHEHMNTHSHTPTHPHTHTHTHTQMHTHMHKHTQKHRQTHTDTETQIEKERERHEQVVTCKN